jgi:hypothetical protein
LKAKEALPIIRALFLRDKSMVFSAPQYSWLVKAQDYGDYGSFAFEMGQTEEVMASDPLVKTCHDCDRPLRMLCSCFPCSLVELCEHEREERLHKEIHEAVDKVEQMMENDNESLEYYQEGMSSAIFLAQC